MNAPPVSTLPGVEWRPLRVITDERGAVLHMLRADTPGFGGFGEVYFSELRPRVTKGWKLHLRMTQRLAVPVGQIHFVLCDERADSPTRGRWSEFHVGRPERYGLLIIPPGIWYSFRNTGEAAALIANCADLPHDPAESRVLALATSELPYQWPADRA